MRRDPEHPPRERLLRIEPLERPIHPQQRLLRQILRLVRVARHPQRIAEHPPLIPTCQRLERREIAMPAPHGQRLIRRLSRIVSGA